MTDETERWLAANDPDYRKTRKGWRSSETDALTRALEGRGPPAQPGEPKLQQPLGHANYRIKPARDSDEIGT